MTHVLADVALLGWTISTQTVVVGLLTGLTYAVLAAGLVLVYRATGIINFAHGPIGALAASVLALVVLDHGWPFLAALVLAIAIGAAVGAATELIVVRRLFTAPRLMLLVATLGVAQLVFVGELSLPGVEHTSRYPTLLHTRVELGGVVLGGEHLVVLVVVPVVILALHLFLNHTRMGLAVRAGADNPDKAQLAGISVRSVSTLVWTLAGALAAISVVLINPLQGTIVGLPAPSLGPGLLVRALAAALIGSMVSLPRAFLGALAVGVAEAIVVTNVSDPGAFDMMLFLFILILLVVTARPAHRDRTSGAWSLAPRVPPVPEALRKIFWIRHGGLIVSVISVVLAASLTIVFPASSSAYAFSRVAIYALVGLSICVLTGWAGQLSLAQFAFVGLGAMVGVVFVDHGASFPVACVYASLVGGLVAVAIGIPALRVRGLFLAVATLAFAVAARSWLLPLDVFTGGQSVVSLPRSTIFGSIDLRSQRTYYWICLAVVVAVAALLHRLRKGGIGRRIVAVRENEDAAASFGIAPAGAKLTAFAISGAVAALAGALLAGARVTFGAELFSPDQSLQVVAMAVVGGVGSVAGAVLGAVYVVGLPALLGGSDTVGFLTSGIGLLVLLLYLPGGLSGLVQRVTGKGYDLLLRRIGADTSTAPRVVAHISTPPATIDVAPAPLIEAALAVEHVTVRFGGRLAVDDVSLSVCSDEIVGLIGANGAGKSTLLNVISGLVKPASGSVAILDEDVTGWAVHERASLGVGRVFQDARLFGDLTVRDTVKVALEADDPSTIVRSALPLPGARRGERQKATEADEYLDLLGLGSFADAFVGDLSTGTRRIVELCCLLAQQPRLLLLDEPTAGLAQRETEAFGPLIVQIRAELEAAVLIVEHDMPLVMSISDRLVCLAAGREIARGTPAEVRTDPAVVAAYLGRDERAIARSGELVT